MEWVLWCGGGNWILDLESPKLRSKGRMDINMQLGVNDLTNLETNYWDLNRIITLFQ